jgi:small subunit ribosomal protein S1
MSDDAMNGHHEEDSQSFADLLESYSKGMQDDLQIGDKVSGKIIAIGRDSVFIDTGTKVDGVTERNELLDEEGNLTVAEGDDIELFVVAMTEHEIRLSRAISGIGGMEMLRDAYENGIPVEGKITATCKGGFNVEVMKRRAFCPVSQIDVHYVETPEDYVGQTHEFLITQLEEKGKNIVVSRRKILARAMEEEKKAFFRTLQTGDQYEGRVTRIMPYGAFVELIPGVEGMVHISELGWSRVEKPEAAVRPDERVRVKVLDIRDGDKKGQKKIALSMKQTEGDPWDTAADKFEPGQKVTGKVTRCMKFGAFVEIAPGIEGLVHISEMSYLKRVIHPEDEVTPGETISVLIKDLDLGGRRISLSIRDALGDPWEDVAEKFQVGRVIPGVLEKKENFGYFVTLAPGITGLLPKSKFKESVNPASIEHVKVGDTIAVAVSEINLGDRKITLAPGDADTAEAGAWKEFAPARPDTPMSDLAEKLQQAMAARKE